MCFSLSRSFFPSVCVHKFTMIGRHCTCNWEIYLSFAVCDETRNGVRNPINPFSFRIKLQTLFRSLECTFYSEIKEEKKQTCKCTHGESMASIVSWKSVTFELFHLFASLMDPFHKAFRLSRLLYFPRWHFVRTSSFAILPIIFWRWDILSHSCSSVSYLAIANEICSFSRKLKRK